MRIVHVCDGWGEGNGAANIARMLAGEQSAAGHDVVRRRFASVGELKSADEVWIHCGWMPCLWWAAAVVTLVRTFGRRAGRPVLKWMPEACYDPVRLAYHGWKKRLAGPVERWALRRCDRIVATCPAEAEWIRAYEPAVRDVAVEDVKRFFALDSAAGAPRRPGPLRLLYLGRRHPLKGVEYLERAAAEAEGADGDGRGPELRIVSDAFGKEKEKVWEWCDALVLPTLSDNFGLVVAEALERGKKVVTTDGAPAWSPGEDGGAGAGVRSGFGGRLLYLSGYRQGDAETRVRLLKEAIAALGTVG